MKPGDRVRTPAGPATITRIFTDTHWIFGRPEGVTWIVVTADTDTDGRKRVFPPTDIQLEEAETPWP